MILSDKHQFVFIHVPRTAGTSMRHVLFNCCEGELRDERGVATDPGSPRHAFAKAVRADIGEQKWNAYFTFSFVRNPWERIVSWYTLSMFKNMFPRPFSEFLQMDHMLPPAQAEYLFDDAGKKLVKFIGRYENLDNDFSSVCSHIGIRSALPRKNQVPLPHAPYRTYYDNVTHDIIIKRYQQDIKLFGYTFDG